MATTLRSRPSDPSPFHQTHILCCGNQRPAGHPRSCCADRGGIGFMNHLARRIADEGLGDITVTEAGCMERCELGPAFVIYPEAVWYTCESEADIDEIVESHLKGGKPVERLVLEPDRKLPKEKPLNLLEVEVVEVRDETPAIKAVVLAPVDGATLPGFEAGAHVDIMTETGLRRSYSLAGDTTDTSRWLLGIQREVNGRGGSAWIHEAVRPGMRLRLTPPANNFPLAEKARRHVLIAGGIGITPILAMARRLNALGATYELHYAARSPEMMAFANEVRAVAGDRAQFYFDGGDPRRGVPLASLLENHAEGDHVYVCGPAGMIEATRTAARHWPEEAVHFELFTPPPANPAWNNEPFEIVLSRRRLTLTVPANQSILETIRAAGVAMDSSCEQGVCGTCEVRVLSGAVEHRDTLLSEEAKAGGDVMLTCISRARPGEKLILDL